ncbi:hypothetical protein [Salmonella bongori]|uniref:hypothetical protein n=1 Tax=Salmonella bongori TaxID=54736 RepID=UPI0015EC2B8C|nr:hypothetical protein [Salmonella bongori]
MIICDVQRADFTLRHLVKGAMIAQNFSCQHRARRDKQSVFILSALSPGGARLAPSFYFPCGSCHAVSLRMFAAGHQ